MKVPILVLAFNRADHVEQAMLAIKEYKPERLYLECDGPRMHKQGEKEAVEATRKVVKENCATGTKKKTVYKFDSAKSFRKKSDQ